ncbi:iron-siderophore ABC transporter substrate-binding protein [Nonomuraea recticatena]|uniref:Iron-siderophore ABC transporter substrate-binding protein n=1 Tax=Nonomuraea recticatena TaxID=46178 RepID=A0ABN3SRE9_9ACTN
MLRRVVAVLALAMAATACGSTAAPTAGQATQSAAAAKPVSIKGADGVAVELKAPATKVVSLEWTYTEDLLALGVTPVGVADVDNYETWVTAGERVKGRTTDVGTRQEPSLEKITALAPDLIVAEKFRVGQNLDALKQIAPVVVLDYTGEGTGRTQYAHMRQTLKDLAVVVGRQAEADRVLAGLDAKIAEVKGRLEKAGKAGTDYTVTQGYTGENAPVLRLLADNSLAAQVLAEAGLKNAWKGKGDSWGMTETDVEALKQVDRATLLYVASDKDNVFTGALAKNPIWQGLTFVKEKRALPLDPGTWLWGGPKTTEQLLEETAKALGA